ncbi:MAG: flagellar M-ring protein FliF [Alphaproteobacteria bacterium]|nr:flagellar M-ring protein FliF [Alphaproteobacteria bacterium]MBP9868496.1 flagellar M-ring protein FliF [Alphaproteobacteria bacterium]
MNNFFDTLRKLGPARLSVMGAVVLGLLIFFIFVSMQVTSPNMKILYRDLPTEDASSISAKLEELKIQYEVSGDGTRIMVSDKDVGRARMALAQEGLPNGGSLGYELFDKQSSFGTTNFVQNITQVRAMEGELARTISSLESIKSARVHLVLPQRELFSRESRPASASVFLHLRGAAQLDKEQIAGIQSLIASAVPDLKSKNVSIVDSAGNLLARGGEDESQLASDKNEEVRRKYEQRMTQTIEDLVGRTVGYGKVRANVVADMNFDQITQNEEIYDPQGQVVRSTQTVEDKNTETQADSNNVSVEKNLPGGNSDLLGQGGPTSASNRNEETTNFEINKTVRSMVRESGQVQKMSVAVLVDGTYTTDKEGKKTYQPRTKEELDRLTALVSSAIGVDTKRGDKIEVVNMQFVEVDTTPETDNTIMGFEKSDLLDAAEILTVAIMIILVVLLVLQPMVGRLLATEGGKSDEEGGFDEQGLLPSMQQNPALTGPSMSSSGQDGGGFAVQELIADEDMINVQKVEGRVKASSLKKVEDIITAYPEETVSVLRGWMTQES